LISLLYSCPFRLLFLFKINTYIEIASLLGNLPLLFILFDMMSFGTASKD